MKRDFLAITISHRRTAPHHPRRPRIEAPGSRGNRQPLAGLTVGCIFHKPSLRTRISFETGIHDGRPFPVYHQGRD